MAVKNSSVTSSPPTKQADLELQDEGVVLGNIDTINFVGAGVTATILGNTGTITIPGGGGGSSFTAATIVVPYGLQAQVVNVVDAAIAALSKVFITWGMYLDTDENTAEMENVFFHARALAGSMDVTVSCADNFGVVGGTYKIMYLVS